MNCVKLTQEKLCVETIYNLVCSPEFGAVSLFVGTTRNNFQGKIVKKLYYEAYEKMALKTLENICQRLREKFNVGNIAIFHRLGDVPIQEASVIIAISSSHRNSVLKAIPFAIDALKADVPIWKKEEYESGEASEWKENSELEETSGTDNTNYINLYEEIVEADTKNEIPSHLIQVKANLQEINRRINSFIYKKRQQVNINNIQDFCLEGSADSEKNSCARVSAVLKRSNNSKSHLKVHRVENLSGPQTNQFDTSSSALSQDYFIKNWECPPGAEERLLNVEKYLNMNLSSKDVYSRLKTIENKILFLESISPEYFDFERQNQNNVKARSLVSSKRAYSTVELDLKLQDLESKLKKKS